MRVKTNVKRQAILNAAGEVFREQGFGGASMTAVAERIGGSKATLYRYFSSKEDLFLAAMLDSALEHFSELFDPLTPGKDLRRTLEKFATSYLGLALSDAALSVRRILISEGHRSGAGQRLFERGPKVTWSRMADFMAREISSGRLQAGDAWTMAMHLRGMLEADLVNRALVGAEVDGRPANLRRHAVEAVDAWLRAYGTESA
jgi:AcrR family transcriptional regulator